MNEYTHLEKLAPQFSSYDGFNSLLIKKRYQHLQQFFVGTECLELGSADGKGTEELVEHFDNITALDGTKEYVEKLNAIDPEKITTVHSLIEEYSPKKKFDTVILAHVLEHVDDPIAILSKITEFVKKNGVFIVDVPNANSLHRLVGVKMGLIESIHDLHQGDLRIGHRRVYTLENLQSDLKKSGFRVLHVGGMFIKPLSNQQIADTWSEELIDAYFELGEDYPHLSSEIYAVCTV